MLNLKILTLAGTLLLTGAQGTPGTEDYIPEPPGSPSPGPGVPDIDRYPMERKPVWTMVSQVYCYTQGEDMGEWMVYEGWFTQSEAAHLVAAQYEGSGVTCEITTQWAQRKMKVSGVPVAVHNRE